MTEIFSIKYNVKRREAMLKLRELTEDENKLLENTIDGIYRKLISFKAPVENVQQLKKLAIREGRKTILEMPLPSSTKDKLLYFLERRIYGMDKLFELLQIPEIEEIIVNEANKPVYIVHRRYGSLRTNIIFSKEELARIASNIATLCGKRISLKNPIVEGQLPYNSRLQMIYGGKFTKDTTITIRKFLTKPLSLLDLIKNRTLTIEMAAYLWLLVDLEASFIICGKPGAGKTTFVQALLSLIPPEKRIVTLESTPEINILHENWLPLYYSDEKSEMRLFSEVLRQRPDYFIVGEIRKPFEATTWVQALNSGILGMSTIHAESAREVIRRLESKPINLKPRQIAQINVIVTLKAFTTQTGIHRKVLSIEEILGTDETGERLLSQITYVFQEGEFRKAYPTQLIYNLSKTLMNPIHVENELRARTEFLRKCLIENHDYTLFRREIVKYYEERNQLE